ncbi:MAG: L-aminopeptidase/D-esterase-like protein [bacterium]|jgi:L-aminopeptidase/D-esterase-like protein
MMDVIETQRWRVGERNLITDVPGLIVGCAQSHPAKSGVTVLTANKPFVASVDVMGGAPGTRETDCLAPDKLVQEVDALTLSGGSAFGLDAASGVMDALRARDKGFVVGPVKVPIVPAAIIFDLINGGASNWQTNPYRALGLEAYENASEDFLLGSYGAGTGATTAMLKGGLGSSSLIMPNGVVVGALVVVNPHGSVVAPGSANFWAAPFEMNDEFGGLGVGIKHDAYALPSNEKLKAYEAMYPEVVTSGVTPQGMNTTIAIVATNVIMDKAQLKRLAVSAQDGMARAIVPSHTPFDGDLIFALSTSERKMQTSVLDSMQLGHAAAVCLSRAIARGVYHASEAAGDTLPVWSSLET